MLPVRGATFDKIDYPLSFSTFQSMLPVRGATLERWQAEQRGAISIHAPRAGSDPGLWPRGQAP